MKETLFSLYTKCKDIGRRYTDAQIPILLDGKEVEITLEDKGSDGNYWVEMTIK